MYEKCLFNISLKQYFIEVVPIAICALQRSNTIYKNMAHGLLMFKFFIIL